MIRRQAESNVHMLLLASTAALLLVLPFVTTFDEFLTRGAQHFGFVQAIQVVVPGEVRMVVTVLGLLGVHSVASGSTLFVWHSGVLQPVYISWNCLGWQSFILFAISLAMGIRAAGSWESRIQLVLIGAIGTFFVNLIRMVGVAWLAASAGHMPALLFHDYGGTLLTVMWLFAFWIGAYRWLLPAESSEELEMAS